MPCSGSSSTQTLCDGLLLGISGFPDEATHAPHVRACLVVLHSQEALPAPATRPSPVPSALTVRDGPIRVPEGCTWPSFACAATATTYLAVEAGGTIELAARWLDAVADALQDVGILIPPPPALRAASLSDDIAVLSAPVRDRTGSPPGLTRAEREVLDLLLSGASNRDIAVARGTSIGTVSVQVSAVMHKLGAASRAEVMYLCRALRSP